ncbi:uncharacterized protein CC84DRAFT_1170362 [Paraphaeosphaeria sporulosa]|uniref:Uncharacterized protein n=1 Tax=Paraphaeosphaeria sporulosa TaxID=1460663 RepID=A0A177CX31_9PLEO|nr:uncharacterized protein CC84DRAFT_1170362 [Paraphaeosphaeria sporulosa]OAG11462.1 hypothetical protein CC84DRAFT_1170362 [Paraphaeosphaeria sporulosa]
MASSNRPRLEPRGRQLSRFFEPLVLLHTLGSTRGEHTRDITYNGTEISCLSRKHLIRRFLCDLAYMCDYDKGGDTVTAIGLESRPHGNVFWVASNTNPSAKIIPFLNTLLVQLRNVSIEAPMIAPEEVQDLATMCITFATPRIKKYKSHLRPLLRRCLKQLDKKDKDSGEMHSLARWLRTWDDIIDPEGLCHFAYRERKSDYMQLLARLGTEPSYKSNKDAIHHAFSSVRHYIGRLGHHFRAANDLISCSFKLSDVLHDFEVRGVPILTGSIIPPADGKTTLESMIKRMLPAGSPSLESYERKLQEMDSKYDLSRRFLENYREPGLKPRVHAEIHVLEHFHVSGLRFIDGDSFIACSKPACFCCLLYLRAHPGQFVEPLSHHKIYLNWRPPDLHSQKELIGEFHQRDILNAMTKTIRREALRQIDDKIPPHPWHPDSLTGITESARGDATHRTNRPGEAFVLAQKHVANTSLPVSRSSTPVTGEQRVEEGCEQQPPHDSGSSVVDYFLDDSDLEGGIPI